MSLLNSISNSIGKQRERAIRDAQGFNAQIEDEDLYYVCQLAIRKLPTASLPLKGRILTIIKNRIENEEDTYKLYEAFVEMDRIFSRKGDSYARHFSQMLGAKLDDLGDSRVEVIYRNDSDRPTYKPRY